MYSVTPLRSYRDEDVHLRLPGDLTVFNIDWFSVFNAESGENFGSISIPDNLNVPPSLLKVIVRYCIIAGKALCFLIKNFCYAAAHEQFA